MSVLIAFSRNALNKELEPDFSTCFSTGKKTAVSLNEQDEHMVWIQLIRRDPMMYLRMWMLEMRYFSGLMYNDFTE